MPVARIASVLGRILITAGLLVLLFVAYQLWGTGLAEARAQDDLRDEFAAVLETTTTTSAVTSTTSPPGGAAPEETTSTTSPTTTTTTTTAPRPEGRAVAILRIPAVGIDKAVVEGVGVNDLKKGPGHYPTTPLPGEGGNSAIAGHRTTYGAPFGDLGDVEEGDEILVTTRDGDFRYVVDRIRVVSPSQVEVLAPTTEPRLTLTTCHPRYSARKRLIISGVLAGEQSAPAAESPTTTTPTTSSTSTTMTPAVPDGEPIAPAGTGQGDDVPGSAPAVGTGVQAAPASIDDPSLAGDPAARVPAAGWAAATALVALVASAVGRRWRRWPAYLVALPVGAVTLFLCFEQVARLLPANI